MRKPRSLKAAILAATSLVAATGLSAAAHANEAYAPLAPSYQDAVAPVVAEPADEGALNVQKAVERAGLIALGLGAIAWLLRLVGPKRVLAAAKQTAQATAQVSAAAAQRAVRAVGSPLRFAVLMTGLALFALTGVGLYDVEWIGGLLTGAGLAGVVAYGWARATRLFQLRPAPVKRKGNVNTN